MWTFVANVTLPQWTLAVAILLSWGFNVWLLIRLLQVEYNLMVLYDLKVAEETSKREREDPWDSRALVADAARKESHDRLNGYLEELADEGWIDELPA